MLRVEAAGGECVDERRAHDVLEGEVGVDEGEGRTGGMGGCVEGGREIGPDVVCEEAGELVQQITLVAFGRGEAGHRQDTASETVFKS